MVHNQYLLTDLFFFIHKRTIIGKNWTINCSKKKKLDKNLRGNIISPFSHLLIILHPKIFLQTAHCERNVFAEHSVLGFTLKSSVVGEWEQTILRLFYLENGLLFLLLPRIVVPAGPSLALSRNQLAGGSFKSVFSWRRANAACGGAEEYFTTALLFTSLPPKNTTDP